MRRVRSFSMGTRYSAIFSPLDHRMIQRYQESERHDDLRLRVVIFCVATCGCGSSFSA